ncbi:MAG: hypothetical protein ACFFD1_02955 [Candidatus Thorarchaeota archaeon]
MDSRTFLYISYFNLFFSIIQLYFILMIIIFISEYAPPDLAIYIGIFSVAPMIVVIFYIFSRTPRRHGQRYWVKPSVNEDLYSNDTILTDLNPSQNQTKIIKPKLLIIKGTRIWGISFITSITLLFYPAIVIGAIIYTVSFWVVAVLTFVWLLIWIRISFYAYKENEKMVQKGFQEKFAPSFNKNAALNLIKIFELYNEISFSDIARILAVKNQKEIVRWFKSLPNFPGLTMLNEDFGIKIRYNDIKDFIPEILKNFENNYLKQNNK